MLSDQQIVAALLDSVPELVAVYRFGSTIGAETHRTSDVDIAFLAAAPLDPVVRFHIQERLAVLAGRDVDLVDLRTASTVMRIQVISTGALLSAIDPAEQESFEDLAYSAYARLNEERREILEQVPREGTVYGG